MLYTIRRMPYTASFRLRRRSNRATEPDTLPLRLHIYKDKQEATAVTVAHVLKADWDQDAGQMKGRIHAALNKELAAILYDVDQVYRRQLKAGLDITAHTIRQEYVTKTHVELLPVTKRVKKGGKLYGDATVIWSPVDVLSEFILFMQADGTGKATIGNYENALKKLSKFMEDRPAMPVQDLSVGWGIEYYVWMRNDEKLAAITASQYIGKLSAAIDHFIIRTNGKVIKANPLRAGKWSKGKTREVKSLTLEEFNRFWMLQHEEKHYEKWWWYAFMMLTGMNYPDAKKYIADRKQFDVTHNGERFIVHNRIKTGVPAYVPVDQHHMADKLTGLLEGKIPPPPNTRTIQYYGTSVIPKRIGLPFRCTPNIARKTAGQLFLDSEHSITLVSGLLGHQNPATTAKYYARVRLDTMANELRKKVKRADVPVDEGAL